MRILILLITLLCSLIVSATEYTASSEQEVKKLVSVLLPGDTLLFKASAWHNTNLLLSGKGTAQQPITFLAAQKGKVLLTGNTTLKISGEHLIVDGFVFTNGGITNGSVIEFRDKKKDESRYCRLTNCSIIDYNPDDKNVNTKWVSLYGEHNRVDHCYFKGKSNLGTTLVVWLNEKPNYHLIDSNFFAERPVLGQNGGETIRIGTGEWSDYISKTTVEHNLFERCNGEVEIISNKSCENIYRYNTFRNCEGALTLRSGNRCLVEGNFFFGEQSHRSGGVRIIGEDHVIINNYFRELEGKDYTAAICIVSGLQETATTAGYHPVKNPLIAFNTFFNNKNNIIIGYVNKSTQRSIAPDNVTIANNAFYLRDANPASKIVQQPEGLTVVGSIYANFKSGGPHNDAFDLMNPMQVYNETLLTSASNELKSGEAAPGYDIVKLNIFGQPREGAKEIGCFQHSDAPKINLPLIPDYVGPAYKPHNQ